MNLMEIELQSYIQMMETEIIICILLYITCLWVFFLIQGRPGEPGKPGLLGFQGQPGERGERGLNGKDGSAGEPVSL